MSLIWVWLSVFGVITSVFTVLYIELLINLKKERMAKVELNNYDLTIKTLDDGQEVVQIVGRLAFNDSFIAEMKEQGVTEWVEQEKEDQEEE